jgi:hypothetical protein
MKLKIALASALLMASSAASALMITVADIDITNNGKEATGQAKKGLNWWTNEGNDFSFTLSELGATQSHQYGILITNDFNFDIYDLQDEDDIVASFLLSPPGLTSASQDGQVMAKGEKKEHSNNQKLTIDFDNDWIGFGALYEMRFKDATIMKKDGDVGLFADFRLVAVPEPSTILLFGAGLLGMGFIRRRKI